MDFDQTAIFSGKKKAYIGVMRKFTQFYLLLRFLRKKLNLSRPFRVRRVKMPDGYAGDCSLQSYGFLIRIDRGGNEDYAIETLLHELAHALAWDKDKVDWHGSHWGKAYSVVYRKWLEFLEVQDD